MPKGPEHCCEGLFLSRYEAVRIGAGCTFATWKYIPMRLPRALHRRHCQRYNTAPLKEVQALIYV
jgi:hypothetical protein